MCKGCKVTIVTRAGFRGRGLVQLGPRLCVQCSAVTIFKFLTIFEQEALHVHFALDPINDIACLSVLLPREKRVLEAGAGGP